MKNIFNYSLSFLALSAMMLSCAKEDEHQPGEPDLEGCYEVYFPAQESALILDPADPTTTTVSVMRSNANGSITVPVTLTDTSGLFTASDLRFEDGQSESQITVTFDKIEIGKAYTVNFEITDPQYASRYNSSPIAFDLSITREKWNLLGKIGFSEDFMWGFSVPSDHSLAAEVYQNDNDENLFRIENPFSKRYINFEDGSEWFVFRVLQPGDVVFPNTKAETTITQKDLVYYDDFNTGYTNDTYKAKIWLMHPGGFTDYLHNQSSWSFNKVLQYQDNGLPAVVQIAPFYYMQKLGGWDGSQESSIVITFPGAVLTDYSIDAVAGESVDGEIPVEFEFGVDVASAKYAVYEGALSTAAKQKNAEAIADGTESSAKVVPASGALSLSCPKSGVYTLVAVSFDKDGKAQENVSIEFGYVAKGEEDKYAANLSAGIELTSRYEPFGFTKSNSALIYVYGKDLVDVKVGVFKTSALSGATVDDVVATLKSVGDSLVNVINDYGYSDIVRGLSPLTSYTIVAWGTNGYSSSVATAKVTTEGTPRIDLGTGTFVYNFWWAADEEGTPFYDRGLEFQKDPNYVNTYVISPWGENVEFKFTYDPKTGAVKVPMTYIGDDHPTYGSVYVAEAKDAFVPEYKDYDKLTDSYYDAKTRTFNFCLAYFVEAGVFDWTIETFTLDQDVDFTASSAAAAALPTVAVKKFSSVNGLGLQKSVLRRAPFCSFRTAGIAAEREVRSVEFSSREIQPSSKESRFDKSNIIKDLRKIDK